MEKESCHSCGALPCDWVTDPHKKRDLLIFALAEIRQIVGVDEKPMLSDLPDVIRTEIDALRKTSEEVGHLRKALQTIYLKWLDHDREEDDDDFDEGYSECLDDMKNIAYDALTANS